MNATKPEPARSAPDLTTAAPSSPASSARRRDADVAKSTPAAATNVQDDDFEHHDTIPAPTWFDDGNESSS